MPDQSPGHPPTPGVGVLVACGFIHELLDHPVFICNLKEVKALTFVKAFMRVNFPGLRRNARS
jgi:hypothetical protein